MLVVLGLANLCVAGVISYAAWFMLQPDLQFRAMFRTPIEGLDTSFLDEMIPTPAGSERPVAPKSDPKPADTGTFAGNTATTIIWTTLYGWLGIVTVAAWLCAAAGGAALGRAGGGRLSRVAMVAMFVSIGLIAFQIYYTYKAGFTGGYEGGCKPKHLRIGAAELTVWFALLGWALARGVRGLCTATAVVMVVGGVAAVVGLLLWKRCGATDPGETPALTLALVLVAHIAWPILLSPLRRAARLT